MDKKHAEGTISCNVAQKFSVMEQSMLLECNKKDRWQNLCSVTERRLGEKTRCSSVEDRNAGCREWLCHLYREWLLSELTTNTSRKYKQTIWHTVRNDVSVDTIVVGFTECCVSNSMNSWWKIMKKTHLVNWVMMCILCCSHTKMF